LKYLDVANGTGESPGFADKIVVHYRGTFADEREFDNSRDNPDLKGQPWEVELAEVIPGWVEGLQSMKVGGKRILVVPPELGFGERGRQGRIPPNATLFYEVELLGVKKPSTGAVKAP
jgi:peptidylprolyl isomerase